MTRYKEYSLENRDTHPLFSLLKDLMKRLIYSIIIAYTST